MREVFLSHASQNQVQARQLRDFLIASGIPVWFSSHHLLGASQWQDEIGQALERCGWFVVVLTPEAIKSEWVKRELQYALDAERYRGRIVPLLFAKCNFRKLSWILPQIQYIDFTQDFAAGCQQLLRVLRKKARRRPT